MASMDDLLSTLSNTLHAGSQGKDLEELQAKLKQTLHPSASAQPHRPVPPSQINPTNLNGGPQPPPAPASSWNDQFAISPSVSMNATRQPPADMGPIPEDKETGAAPAPAPVPVSGNTRSQAAAPQAGGQGRPYHKNVLPSTSSGASPLETDGFQNDAFRPLWDKDSKKNENGSK